MEDLLRVVQYATRMMRGNARLALVATLVLALGISAPARRAVCP
jgi:hypothetical protein